jgi:branched-chain amino acid transport system substrate-binding protein
MSVVQIEGTATKELEPVQVTDIGDADIKPFDGKESTPPTSGIPDEPAAD